MKQYDFVSETDENGKSVITVADAPKRRKIDIIPMIVCFFIALFVWIYMVNLNDTDVTATLTLPVEIVGVEELRDNRNMMLYGVDTNEIVVTVKGSNRDLRRFTQSDYKAVIDVRDIISSGRHSRTVAVSVPSGSTITLDTKEVISVNFYTDIRMTKQVPFDYLQGNWITNPNYTYTIEKNADMVEVTGPKSIIDSIENAKFRIPDDEYYTSKSFMGFQLSFLDKNGENVNYDSSVVTYSTTDISVKVVVTMQKPIMIDVKLPEGVSGLIATADPDDVYIQGDPAVISSVNKYTIVLTEEDIASGEPVIITLTDDNLPAGVTFASPEQTVKITVAPIGEAGAETSESTGSETLDSSEITSGETTETGGAESSTGEGIGDVTKDQDTLVDENVTEESDRSEDTDFESASEVTEEEHRGE